MPVLPAEPTFYPNDLFQGCEADDDGRSWYVMHTKPRQEKSLARALSQVRVPFYLPLLSQRRRMNGGRVVTSHIPLFPGYVSVLADRDERQTALESGRIVRGIDVPDQSEFWRDLLQIERLIASDMPITPEDRLGPGDQVRIRSGPLKGLEGTILRNDAGNRFLVQVDFMQRGASVLADDFDVAVLD